MAALRWNRGAAGGREPYNHQVVVAIAPAGPVPARALGATVLTFTLPLPSRLGWALAFELDGRRPFTCLFRDDSEALSSLLAFSLAFTLTRT